MFSKKTPTLRLTLRALAALLGYPDATLRAVLPQLAEALESEQVLRPERLAELQALCRQLALSDPIEVEARYVETFDRGRSTSLHLFEHVHGDSRDRGPALINALFSALLARGTPYASVVAAILEVSGQQAQSVPVAPEPEIDESWDEPAAFDGCSNRGQAKPGQPQPLHFVRNPRASQGASV